MKHILHIRFVLSLLITGAISARAQYVSVDFDKQCDFTAYKTYAWTTGTPAKNPVLAQRITEGVDSKLAAKGLRKVEPGSNPDLIVLYHAAAGADTQINTTNSDGYNWGRKWNGGADTPTTGARHVSRGRANGRHRRSQDEKIALAGVRGRYAQQQTNFDREVDRQNSGENV